jgi:hypothetical protein
MSVSFLVFFGVPLLPHAQQPLFLVITTHHKEFIKDELVQISLNLLSQLSAVTTPTLTYESYNVC